MFGRWRSNSSIARFALLSATVGAHRQFGKPTKMRVLGIVVPIAALATVVLFSTGAQAVTLETTAFLSTPTYFNGFEEINSSPNFNPNNFLYSPTNTPYSEGGITVEYVGSASNVGTVTRISSFISGSQGQYGWYGIGYGYTDVRLTGGDEMQSIQFLAGSGFGYGVGNLVYEVLDQGSVVSTGSVPIRNNGYDRTMTPYGFSGGGFDEIRLQVLYSSTSFQTGQLEAGVFDSFGAVGTVPEPSTWAMLLLGFAGIGFMAYRRKKTPALTPLNPRSFT